MGTTQVVWVRRCLWVNLLCYATFAAAKCSVGWLADARSLWADGWNNMTDLLLSLAMLIGFRVAQRPADERHSFGHRRAETIAALVAAFCMSMAALEVAITSLVSLISPATQSPHTMALPTAVISGGIMILLAALNTYLGSRMDSEMLRVVAQDNRSDAMISAGTACGLVLIQQTGIHWLDPLVAIGVAVMVGKTAWSIGAPAVDRLMDGFDEAQLRRIRKRVERVEGICHIRELRARLHGRAVWVDVTVLVNPKLSVLESHTLTEHIEEALVGREGVENVHVHVEPQPGSPPTEEPAKLSLESLPTDPFPQQILASSKEWDHGVSDGRTHRRP